MTRNRRIRSISHDETIVSTVSSIPSVPSIEVSTAASILSDDKKKYRGNKDSNETTIATTTADNDDGDDNDEIRYIPGEIEIDVDDESEEDDEDDEEDDQDDEHQVSLDHERQILLLFLLAQVCALHDPTPRTFTVHVLGLFEQSLLDHDAIHFLFELGFVPSSSVDSRGLLTSAANSKHYSRNTTNNTPTSTTTPKKKLTSPSKKSRTSTGRTHQNHERDIPSKNNANTIKNHRKIMTTTTTTTTSTELAIVNHRGNKNTNGTTQQRHPPPPPPQKLSHRSSKQSLRSLEANHIRKELSSQHGDTIHYNGGGSKSERNGTRNAAAANADRNANDRDDNNENPSGNKNNRNNNNNTNNNDNNTKRSWHVEHFPLSMSRYEREFEQIGLINSGSFGSVYRAVRELDGCEYAVKKITFNATGYSNESIQRVIREVHCLAAVNDHPNTVRYYTSWLEPTWMTGKIRGVGVGGGRTTTKKLRNQLLQIEHGGINENTTTSFSSALNKDILNGVRNSLILRNSSKQHSINYDDEEVSWSSSSVEYDSDDDFSGAHNSNFFAGGGRRRRFSFGSVEESSSATTDWESYHSHSLKPWKDVVHDDSYVTTTSEVERRRQGNGTRRYSSSRGSRRRRRRSSSSRGGGGRGRLQQQIATVAPKKYQYQISLYIQMELCHPATLQDWIAERNKRVPESNHQERIGPAIEIFHQLCDGLAHIHKSNVIHRDLKPANVFVCSEGKTVKIGDFGLSKQLHDIATTSPHCSPHSNNSNNKTNYWHTTNTTTTETTDCADAIVPAQTKQVGMTTTAIIPTTQTMVKYDRNRNKMQNGVGVGGDDDGRPLLNNTTGVGTASYAAPEQVQSKTYDTAVDVFSLGLILLELISCFETDHERLHNIQQCRYQKLPDWIHDNYPDVAQTILACTKPNAKERPKAKDLLLLLNAGADFGFGRSRSSSNTTTTTKQAMMQTLCHRHHHHHRSNNDNDNNNNNSNDEVRMLQKQLIEKDNEISQKDETIESMKLEIEKMKSLLLAANKNNDSE